MYYIKRWYTSWWSVTSPPTQPGQTVTLLLRQTPAGQSTSYFLEAGLDVGIALSGIIQTFVFAFTNNGKGIAISWWGNEVATAGVDYQAYNQNATLQPIPPQGYFGLWPDEYPMSF